MASKRGHAYPRSAGTRCPGFLSPLATRHSPPATHSAIIRDVFRVARENRSTRSVPSLNSPLAHFTPSPLTIAKCPTRPPPRTTKPVLIKRPIRPNASERTSTMAVFGLCSLRALHLGLPDLSRNGERERQPPRPHLPNAGRDRRPPGIGADRQTASRFVPRLPKLRNGLSLGRPIRPADRTISASACAGPRLRQPDGTLPAAEWFERLFLYGLFPHPGRMKAALFPARLLAADWGLDRLIDADGASQAAAGSRAADV